MTIKHLKLVEGVNESNDSFSAKSNLIFSHTNTAGKSTYLRLLFFSLGYPIPDMKGIRFNSIRTEILVEIDGKDYTITRQNNLLSVSTNSIYVEFVLPSEHMAFLSYIFNYNNIKVLKNLLGIIYIDQDKGWSLLNRGTVIGKIKFNIEELLSGLSNIDIDVLLQNKATYEKNKAKYSAMLNLHELSEQVCENNGDVYLSNPEQELLDKIAYNNLKIKNLKSSLKEVSSLLRDEKGFYTFVNSMNLSVQKDGVIIDVTNETIVNLPENTEYLKARQSVLVMEIAEIKNQITVYQSQLNKLQLEKSEISLFQDDPEDTILNKQLANINIDQTLVRTVYEKNKKELSNTKFIIKDTIKKESEYIQKIYKYVCKYATKLGVDDKIVAKQDYIFTSDLKSMSGAVLQKIVFAFKVAFLKVIEEEIGTKLFMVLDSPKGKELDDANTDLIMKLIKDEFNENQIFIASIFDFDVEKKIEIKSCAIEKRT